MALANVYSLSFKSVHYKDMVSLMYTRKMGPKSDE